ncbi:MAG: hypothetical protein IJ729_00390 [Alloprevotella sp.]|nr:hypothetical protein [Alloprevotella sp.]
MIIVLRADFPPHGYPCVWAGIGDIFVFITFPLPTSVEVPDFCAMNRPALTYRPILPDPPRPPARRAPSFNRYLELPQPSPRPQVGAAPEAQHDVLTAFRGGKYNKAKETSRFLRFLCCL